MFSFYSVILDLIKARTHKYIRRIPVGATKTGATKYRYFYQGQEGHGQGIAHESELVVGASFAFGEGENKYHAHITKVDGSNIIIEHDDGAKKGTQETISKQDFQKRVHAEHKDAIKIAHEKSKAQFARVEQMKEGGAKVQQKTLDKWSTQVNKLKDIADLFDKPAEIDAPWMTAKEKRVFEGQNRLFKMLQNREITLGLLKDRTHRSALKDMVSNVCTAIFKYKDLSELGREEKQILAHAARDAIVESSDDHMLDLVSVLSGLWKILPFTKDTKSTTIGRMDVIQVDFNAKSQVQKKQKKIQTEAIEKAQKDMLSLEPELSKILYGNIIYTQINSSLKIQASGFYVYDQPIQNIEHITTKLETVSHAADVVYLESENVFTENDWIKKILPADVLRTFQINYQASIAIHELAHRFSSSLFEQKDTVFSKDIDAFYKKFGTDKREEKTLLDRPIKEYTFASNREAKLVSLLETYDIYVQMDPLGEAGKILSKEGTEIKNIKSIPFAEIDYMALGNAKITKGDNGFVNINFVLKDGNILRVPTYENASGFYGQFNEKRTSLPTSYSHKNVEEMFSEMMSAVCDPDYKDEPMRTEFLALIKKHKRAFGA